jgi:hypothetical protein
LPNNTLLMKRCLFIWDSAFGHIQVPTSTPRCSRPHSASILGVYIVVGSAPNVHTIKKFGLDLKHSFGPIINLMYL